MPCPNSTGGYWYWPPLHGWSNGYDSGGYSQPVWIPCPGFEPTKGNTLIKSDSFVKTNPAGPAGNQPGSGNPATDQYYWHEQDALLWGGGGDSPPVLPFIPANFTQSENDPVPPGGLKDSKLRKNIDPCNGSSQLIKNSQVPPSNGDPSNEWDPNGSNYYGTPHLARALGLQIERILADVANNLADYTGSDLESSFEAAVKTITSTDSPEEVADKLINAILGANLLPYGGPVVPGELSPELISVLDQLAQEIEQSSTAPPNIDWGAFAAYLAAQANADADALQSSYLGGGALPCGDISNAVNNAKNNQRNNQKKANNALKKLDPNINPPKLPPGHPSGEHGHPTNTNDFSSVTAPTYNVSKGSGHKMVKFGGKGPQINVKGPTVDVTRVHHSLLPPHDLGLLGDSLAQSQGLSGGTLTPTPLLDFDPVAQAVIDQIHNTALTLLNILDDVLGFLTSQDPDPITGVTLVGPALDNMVKHTEEKLDALNALSQQFPNEPTDLGQKLKWDDLRDERIRLENWYHAITGDYYGNYP